MKSVLQHWVMELGLRHQGVLLTAIRGCDTAPKEDASKAFTRIYRGVVLNAACGDPKQSASFMTAVTPEEEGAVFSAFRRDLDHYPHHFVMHMIHAIEIVGYKHPDLLTRERWYCYYERLCKGLHVNVEWTDQLDKRLNADEVTFGKEQIY